jgi:hypothetical protein
MPMRRNGSIPARLRQDDCERSERLIQMLLSETHRAQRSTDIVTVSGPHPTLRTCVPRRTYAGYSQAENFTSPSRITKDRPTLFRPASVLSLNQWAW